MGWGRETRRRCCCRGRNAVECAMTAPGPSERSSTRTAWSLKRVVGQVRWLSDRLFDLLNGTDTAGAIEPADMTVVGPHRDRGVRYQLTRPRAFRRLLRRLDLPAGEVFVDIGCGKGRVLMLAREFGFRKIVGVEYAPALCAIAQRNVAAADAAGVVIHCCDAVDYDFAEGETVIFLFNPFDGVVLGKMLERLEASLRRDPRKAWLIYHFPRWMEVIESHGVFRRIGCHAYDGCEFVVYVHEPDRAIS